MTWLDDQIDGKRDAVLQWLQSIVFGKDSVIVILERVMAPGFALWKWKEKDFEKRLTLHIDATEIHFQFLSSEFGLKTDREFAMHARLILVFKKPDPKLLEGLRNPAGVNGPWAAEKIYSLYTQTLEEITFYGRWVAKLPSIVDGMKSSFSDLFSPSFSLSSVYWKQAKEKPVRFILPKKKSKKINPLFKSTNLLTVEKWAKMEKYLRSKPPTKTRDIEELVRIKYKVEWGHKRIPTIETAALMEVVLRNKLQSFLIQKGQSKTKLENFRKEVGLSLLLNMHLPAILGKTKFSANKKYIDALDDLRGVRNKIMHDNIIEEQIDIEKVKRGIDAAIKLTRVLGQHES